MKTLKLTLLLIAASLLLTFNLFAQANEIGAGNALNFDGITNDVTVGSFMLPAQYTISLWVKPSNAGGYRLALGKEGPGTSRIQMMVNNAVWGFVYGDGNGVPVSGVPVVDQWQHLAVVINGTSITTYYNGYLQNTGTAGPISGGASMFHIGWNGLGSDKHYSGEIDEVRIWNVARTQEQIRQYMCQQLKGNETGLVGYWKFDEDTGSTAYDSSPNGSDGTLMNMSDTNRVISGAAIGDTSTYIYPVLWTADTTLNLAHPDGDDLTVSDVTGSPAGVHIYRIDSMPADTTGITGLNNNDRYLGVFTANGSSPTYSATYNYNGNPYIINEDSLLLFTRTDNADTLWADANAILNTTNNTLTKTLENERGEYILHITGTPLGIASQFSVSSSQFSVYPNPGNGEFTIKCQMTDSKCQKANVVIYDMLGQGVYQQQLNGKQQTLNTKLSKGMYTLQLINDEGMWSEKIIIQ